MHTFEEYFTTVVRAAAIPPRIIQPGECQSAASKRCRLCFAVDLTYEKEIALKNKALREFWRHHVPQTPLSPLVVSPLGRAYRTVTKRKAFLRKGRAHLGLIDPSESGSERWFSVIRCAIEPEEHARIYSAIRACLEKPYSTDLGENMNYVIIKGSYTEFTVILNVGEISASIIRAANTLSKSLTYSCKNVVSLFLYEEASHGRYYMGAKNPGVQPHLKKIFGKSEIYQRIAGRGFLYSPLSFSQVNQSIVERLVAQAGELLAFNKNQTLYDLYCGYGLFSVCLADKVRRVVGVEVSPQSVEAAEANATRNSIANARFIRSDITATSLEHILKHASPDDVVLLDPPRNGTAEGVIEAIAARKPKRILHLFCNIDLLSSELQRWKSCGYKPIRAIPFDLFPGTSEVEIMVMLEVSSFRFQVTDHQLSLIPH